MEILHNLMPRDPEDQLESASCDAASLQSSANIVLRMFLTSIIMDTTLIENFEVLTKFSQRM